MGTCRDYLRTDEAWQIGASYEFWAGDTDFLGQDSVEKWRWSPVRTAEARKFGFDLVDDISNLPGDVETLDGDPQDLEDPSDIEDWDDPEDEDALDHPA